MRRPAVLFGLAALVVVAHVAAKLAGWEDHTSMIAGMPRSAASSVIGPMFVVLHLGVALLAPILLIAGTLDTLLALVARRARQPAVTRPS